MPVTTAVVRRVLADSINLLRSVEVDRSLSSTTLDHAIQEEIKLLKRTETSTQVDDSGQTRISRWDELNALEANLVKVVDEIMSAGTDKEALAKLGIIDEEEADDREQSEVDNTAGE